jgi:glycoside/pentoside/hexuronide:cation symporter, GPH family
VAVVEWGAGAAKEMDESPKPGFGTILAYGLGSVSNAVKSAPMSAFLLIFYNQVVGLSALQATAVMTATLVLDAICDPVVGQLSDSWRSALGRRLPFMYASVIPLAVSFILLWNPPAGLSGNGLAIYFMIALGMVRIFDTLFELPHLAIVPEITRDYQERTRLYTWRYLFEALGGILVSAMAYNVFLREDDDGAGGILAREGYGPLSLFCALLILVLSLASTIGLQRSGRLRGSVDLPERFTLRARIELFVRTIRGSPVISLSLVAILISVGSGMGSALSMYWLLYYYQFSQAAMSLLVVALALGIIATALTPRIAARLGKRGAIILFVWIYLAATASPLLFRLFDLVPAGSTGLLLMVAIQGAVGTATMTMVMIVLTSMVSDLTEEAERRTGQRSEAMLLSSLNFIRKATQGLGALGAGAILTIVSFPVGAVRTGVAPAQLDALALFYLGGKMVLFLLATIVLAFYRYDSTAARRTGTILA